MEDPWELPGATVWADNCYTENPLVIGWVSMFYLGGACSLEILDHLEYPRWVVDCGNPAEIDEYCVYMNAAVGGAEVPPGDCDSTPVESSSWSAIKSMYR